MEKIIFILILIIIFILILTTQGFCQETTQTGNATKARNNLIFAELGGAVAFGTGLGYERYLPVALKKRFALRGGLGLIDSFSSYTSFFGGSFIYGKKSGLELGINYLINYDANVFRSIDSDDEKFENDIQMLVGYRYQNRKTGVMFRVFYVPPVGCCGTSIPVYAGMSLGYAF